LENNSKNNKDGNIPIINENIIILVKSLKISILTPFLFSDRTNLELTITFVSFPLSKIGTFNFISSKIPRLID
jgi:hypothetical protein